MMLMLLSTATAGGLIVAVAVAHSARADAVSARRAVTLAGQVPIPRTATVTPYRRNAVGTVTRCDGRLEDVA